MLASYLVGIGCSLVFAAICAILLVRGTDYMKENHPDYDGDEFLNKPEEDCVPFFKKSAKDNILKGIEKDLSEFRVSFDNWFSEESLYENNHFT